MPFKPFQPALVKAVKNFNAEWRENPALSLTATMLVLETVAGVFREQAEGDTDAEGRAHAVLQVRARIRLREPAEKLGPEYERIVELLVCLFEELVEWHEPFDLVYRLDDDSDS